ncbi:hypothetical protein LTR36_002207 [Oleoguttula mirabilis]|uniref:Uncharacterized protein n=1 Tax=Oleoguttula mirabilis TaxID=1507867 RepID=A0AAV9JKP3_9PEZI|nr:hypothetical protein LTR36_002207 [Oleoguttula mirabilis]
MPTSKEPSGLFALPAELRNAIYSYAFPATAQEFRFSFGIYQPVPPLLQVCRQVRREATGLYYSTSLFDLMIHHKCSRHLLTWARTGLSAEVRQALRTNSNVTLRIIFDKAYEHHDLVKYCLGKLAWAWEHSPWLIAPESHVDERKYVDEYPLPREYYLIDMRSAPAEEAETAEEAELYGMAESDRTRAKQLLELLGETLLNTSKKIDAVLQAES